MFDSLDALIAFVLVMLVVSLLITIAVQMVSGLFNLRGINLAMGLTETLKLIAPGLDQRARALAKRVLTDPALSDSSIGRHGPGLWRLATVVRPEEAFAALRRLATDYRGDQPGLRDDARSILLALGFDQAVFDAADQKAGAASGEARHMWDAAQTAAAALPSEEGKKVRDALAALRTNAEAHIANAVIQVTTAAGAAEGAYQKFEYWFESVQDRAQQWFTMHTRYVTVFFAVLFAAGLQLDTVELFKLVSTNRSVRDQLVAQAGVVSGQAQRLLADGQSVLQEALGQWLLTQDQDTQSLCSGLKVGASDTRGSIRAQLATALASRPAADRQRLLVAFDADVDRIASSRLEARAADFRTVRDDLEHSGFDLLPKNVGGRWGKQYTDGLGEHWLGMLFSVGLLSLGAPFWYNALKGLTSLRSTVAQSVAEERKQDPPPTNNHPPV